MFLGSQSPQTGQFNSYSNDMFNLNSGKILCLNPLKRVNSILTVSRIFPRWRGRRLVSIPSNGSIQFLPNSSVWRSTSWWRVSIPSNGSIQFLPFYRKYKNIKNSYSLNPLKRVNSILTLNLPNKEKFNQEWVSIPSNGSIQFLLVVSRRRRCLSEKWCLNPLKRVNSILTKRSDGSDIVSEKG